MTILFLHILKQKTEVTCFLCEGRSDPCFSCGTLRGAQADTGCQYREVAMVASLILLPCEQCQIRIYQFLSCSVLPFLKYIFPIITVILTNNRPIEL